MVFHSGQRVDKAVQTLDGQGRAKALQSERNKGAGSKMCQDWSDVLRQRRSVGGQILTLLSCWWLGGFSVWTIAGSCTTPFCETRPIVCSRKCGMGRVGALPGKILACLEDQKAEESLLGLGGCISTALRTFDSVYP